MMARVAAWGLVLGLVYAAFQGVSHWRNPWAVPSPAAAVMSVMPEQPAGCANKCL